VEKFRLEMKGTSVSEDAPGTEGEDEVKQEQNECGPVSLGVAASTEREQSDMTPVKQENATSGRQEEEDDDARRGEGICVS
jgi:hypothetical protein